jgi:membrane protein DedA with SNARE-associated domain
VLDQLSLIISHYGALGSFLASVIEELIFVIPSTLIQMASGFFLLGAQPVSLHSLISLFFLSALPLAAGLVLGSLFTYSLAYYLGKPLIDRWGRYLLISWGDIEALEERLQRHGAESKMIFGFRLFPLIPSTVINIFCGLTRMPLWRYVPLTFFGVIGRAYVVAFAGWQLGSVYHRYAHYIDQFENLGLVVLILIAAYYYWRKKKKGRDYAQAQ